MEEQLKRRLIGATVLTSLAVIFVPMLFDGEPMLVEHQRGATIPPSPTIDKFQSRLIRKEIPAPVPIDLTIAEDPAPVVSPIKSTAVTAVESVPKVTAKIGPVKPLQPITAVPKKPKVVTVRKGLTAWVIQAGSFSSHDNATRLVAKLRKAGFDTLDPQMIEVRGKRLYRVRIGPELNKANATRQLKSINKITGTKGAVVKYP